MVVGSHAERARVQNREPRGQRERDYAIVHLCSVHLDIPQSLLPSILSTFSHR